MSKVGKIDLGRTYFGEKKEYLQIFSNFWSSGSHEKIYCYKILARSYFCKQERFLDSKSMYEKKTILF